jgi:hypothetical protein
MYVTPPSSFVSSASSRKSLQLTSHHEEPITGEHTGTRKTEQGKTVSSKCFHWYTTSLEGQLRARSTNCVSCIIEPFPFDKEKKYFVKIQISDFADSLVDEVIITQLLNKSDTNLNNDIFPKYVDHCLYNIKQTDFYKNEYEQLGTEAKLHILKNVPRRVMISEVLVGITPLFDVMNDIQNPKWFNWITIGKQASINMVNTGINELIRKYIKFGIKYNLSHNDLHTDNIVLTNNRNDASLEYKIIDFGRAYVSPEHLSFFKSPSQSPSRLEIIFDKFGMSRPVPDQSIMGFSEFQIRDENGYGCLCDASTMSLNLLRFGFLSNSVFFTVTTTDGQMVLTIDIEKLKQFLQNFHQQNQDSKYIFLGLAWFATACYAYHTSKKQFSLEESKLGKLFCEHVVTDVSYGGLKIHITKMVADPEMQGNVIINQNGIFEAGIFSILKTEIIKQWLAFEGFEPYKLVMEQSMGGRKHHKTASHVGVGKSHKPMIKNEHSEESLPFAILKDVKTPTANLIDIKYQNLRGKVKHAIGAVLKYMSMWDKANIKPTDFKLLQEIQSNQTSGGSKNVKYYKLFQDQFNTKRKFIKKAGFKWFLDEHRGKYRYENKSEKCPRVYLLGNDGETNEN